MRKVKLILRFIWRLFKKILILVALTILVSVLLSTFVLDAELETVLDYAGIILIALGALSVLGGRGTTMEKNYMLTRSLVSIEDVSMKEMELFTESFQFCLFTGISGLIVLLIRAAIHYL